METEIGTDTWVGKPGLRYGGKADHPAQKLGFRALPRHSSVEAVEERRGEYNVRRICVQMQATRNAAAALAAP